MLFNHDQYRSQLQSSLGVNLPSVLIPSRQEKEKEEKDPGQILQRELVILLLRTPSTHQPGADQ